MKTWEDARDNCVELGGQLFFNVNGTKEQLDFLYHKLNEQNHWLGIYTRDHNSWIDVNDHVVDDWRLLWDPNKKFNAKGFQYHVANFRLKYSSYLNDRNQNEIFQSVCDILQGDGL